MTTATTQTLAAFLLARIEDDEAAARAAIDALGDWDHWAAVGNDAITTRRYDIGAFIFQQNPTRVLAECEARRAILALHYPLGDLETHPLTDETGHYWLGDGETGRAGHRYYVECAECGHKAFPCPTLRAMAAVHSSHPDFDPYWRA